MIDNDIKSFGDDWLSMEDAAKHVGLGKTALYTLAREGKVPANKVGKKWIFERSQLDTWLRSSQSIENFFTALTPNITENLALRDPQRDAYLKVYDFFRAGKNKAIIQFPVGCGKTGLAAILPVGIAKGRVLVIAPNLTIKQGLYDAMDITNRQKCFWRKAQVLTDAQMTTGPFACTLDVGNISVAQKAHIIITNVQQLATNEDKWLMQFSADFFDMIIIDEAHHSAADSWKKVIARFPGAKIIYLTATPFRSDRQEIDGELVDRYPFRNATLKGYIKRLKASYVAPSEIQLGFGDEKGNTYSLEDVLKLKEEDWFSRNIALAKPCNQSIVDNSLSKLEELRLTGTQHQLIAVSCSINHAKDIRSMYCERGYTAEVIHNQIKDDEKVAILASLRNGTLDCIVQVQMLGEGFDHPKLSVAAIFRPFRSLAPYIQFVGRIMRVIVQNDPGHPDNLGHIVTHLGMNLDQRLKEFKQFENDDEAFWETVIDGEDPEVPQAVRLGHTRRTIEGTTIPINNEIVDSLWEEDFTTVEDAQILEELRSKLKSLGLDPVGAEALVKNRPTGMTQVTASGPFVVQPHKKWEEAKKRLNERVQSTAKIILNNVELQLAGREIPFRYTSLGIPAGSNFIAALMMVNNEVDKKLGGKDRKDCSVEELLAASESLKEILEKLVRRIKKAKGDYDKQKA